MVGGDAEPIEMGVETNHNEPLEQPGVEEAPSNASNASRQRRRQQGHGKGTLLEAAFVDPAYSWPPADGQGKNAIELQASLKLMEDEESVFTTESARSRMKSPTKPRSGDKSSWWRCCQANPAAVSAEEMRAYEEQKLLAKEARQQHLAAKQEHYKTKEKAARRAARYTSVPEGILIYRLDTATSHLELVSQPHAKTDLSVVVQECTIMSAAPAGDKSRRSLEITDENGETHILTACEQRTATAWLEAMNLMHAKTGPKSIGAMFRKVRGCECFCSCANLAEL
jgi:hypothetical protein